MIITEKFSLPEFQFCAALLKNGVLQNDLKDIIPKLNEILNKCYSFSNDNQVDKIFKTYIINESVNNQSKIYINCRKDIIINVIVFKQSTDVDITILAKVLYRKYGKFYKEWLDWQIDKFLTKSNVDIKQEYINYRINNNKSYDSIPPEIEMEI